MSSEKATVQTPNNFDKCLVVLLDVLGTTTSINFAKETLFPFVTKNVEEVLTSKWEDDSIKAAVKQLQEGDKDLDLEAAIKLVKELTENGSENQGLKTIQGVIYEKGYESKDLKSHVFSDVPAALESWAKTRKVAIYSTGSTDSQKQLFSKTVEGDLSAHITNYFDQSVGTKTEADSYKKIAEELKVKPEEVLFVTDLIEEAKAAKSAGLMVAVITRDGNAKLPEDTKDVAVISSFKDICFENAAKRKIPDEATTEEPPSKLAKTEKIAKPEENAEKAETTEKIESEAMEVDSKEESKPEETAAKKTEENAPKIEVNATNEDVTMADSTVTEPEKKADKDDKIVTESEIKTGDAKPTTEKVSEEAKVENKDEGKVDSTSNNEVKPEKVEEKKVDNDEAEVKVETKSSETIPEPIEQKPESTEDKPETVEENKSDKEEKKNEADCKTADSKIEESNVEEKCKAEEKKQDNEIEEKKVEPESKKEEKKLQADNKTEESKVESEVSSTEEKPEPSKIEETVAKKAEDEKENKKDMANGVENGDSVDNDKATNGESKDAPKTNGDATSTTDKKNGTEETAESSVETAEEIKAKKVEASLASTEVSVSV